MASSEMMPATILEALEAQKGSGEEAFVDESTSFSRIFSPVVDEIKVKETKQEIYVNEELVLFVVEGKENISLVRNFIELGYTVKVDNPVVVEEPKELNFTEKLIDIWVMKFPQNSIIYSEYGNNYITGMALGYHYYNKKDDINSNFFFSKFITNSAHYWRAKVHGSKHEYQKAVDCLEPIYKLNGTGMIPKHQKMLADCYFYLKDPESAVNIYIYLFNIKYNEELGVCYTIIDCYVAMQKDAEKAIYKEKLFELLGDDSVSKFVVANDLGDIYSDLKEDSMAIEWFLKAYELDDHNPHIALKLAKCYAKVGMSNSATEYLLLS